MPKKLCQSGGRVNSGRLPYKHFGASSGSLKVVHFVHSHDVDK